MLSVNLFVGVRGLAPSEVTNEGDVPWVADRAEAMRSSSGSSRCTPDELIESQLGQGATGPGA